MTHAAARTLTALAVSAALLGSLSAQAAPLANGGLESTASGFIEGVGVGTTANGWTVSNAGIEFVKGGFSSGGDVLAAPHEGQWMVDLNGVSGPGQINQSFDTTPGQWYRVDYWMSGNAGPNGTTAADGSKSLQVLWNGGLAGAATYQHQSGDNWSNLRWEGHAVLVQASGSTSTLAFRSASSFYPSAGPLLDDISITAVVPEPAPLALWGAGLGVFAALRLRRRGA